MQIPYLNYPFTNYPIQILFYLSWIPQPCCFPAQQDPLYNSSLSLVVYAKLSISQLPTTNPLNLLNVPSLPQRNLTFRDFNKYPSLEQISSSESLDQGLREHIPEISLNSSGGKLSFIPSKALLSSFSSICFPPLQRLFGSCNVHICNAISPTINTVCFNPFTKVLGGHSSLGLWYFFYHLVPAKFIPKLLGKYLYLCFGSILTNMFMGVSSRYSPLRLPLKYTASSI